MIYEIFPLKKKNIKRNKTRKTVEFKSRFLEEKTNS